MKSTVKNTLELFANNTHIIKNQFFWQNTLTKRLAALIYAQKDKTVDCNAIRQCYDLIRQNTGAFSAFRGNMALYVAAMLSLSADAQEIFNQTLKVYGLLKDVKFRASDFLVVAAYLIAARSDASEHRDAVNRTRNFYNEMKTRHFFHTGQDDYIFAAMLGLTDLDPAEGTERMDRLYRLLKDEFWGKNSVQALAQVLVLGDSDDHVVHRVLVLRDMLRAQKIKLDKAYTLPVLGILALLPAEIETIVNDIGETRDALREQKGFGPLSVTAQELLLFAASIAAGDYTDSVKDGVLTAALSTGISNIIVAQHVAMIAAISASTAAAASSSS